MKQTKKEKLIEYEKRVCKCGHSRGPDHRNIFKNKIAELFGDTYGKCNKCDCPTFVNREFPLGRHKRTFIGLIACCSFLILLPIAVVIMTHELVSIVDKVNPTAFDKPFYSMRVFVSLLDIMMLFFSFWFIRPLVTTILRYNYNRKRIVRPIQTGLETFCTCSICKKLMGTIRIESGLFVAVCEECNKKTRDENSTC